MAGYETIVELYSEVDWKQMFAVKKINQGDYGKLTCLSHQEGSFMSDMPLLIAFEQDKKLNKTIKQISDEWTDDLTQQTQYPFIQLKGFSTELVLLFHYGSPSASVMKNNSVNVFNNANSVMPLRSIFTVSDVGPQLSALPSNLAHLSYA